MPSPTLQCSSYWKGSLLVALDYGRQLYFTIYIYICVCVCLCVCVCKKVKTEEKFMFGSLFHAFRLQGFVSMQNNFIKIINFFFYSDKALKSKHMKQATKQISFFGFYLFLHTFCQIQFTSSHTHTNVCVHVCVCVCIYIYIYIYIYICLGDFLLSLGLSKQVQTPIMLLHSLLN